MSYDYSPNIINIKGHLNALLPSYNTSTYTVHEHIETFFFELRHFYCLQYIEINFHFGTQIRTQIMEAINSNPKQTNFIGLAKDLVKSILLYQ